MLKAYFDDSGSHNEAAFYVVAGYVAPIEVWLSFEKQWRAVLAAEPAIEYFHGNECFSRSNQFAGFEQADAVAKVYHLVDVIFRHVSYEVSVAIPRPAYDRYIASLIGNADITKYSNPYMFCYQQIAIMMSALFPVMSASEGLSVDLVLDQQKDVVGMVQELHSMFASTRDFGNFGAVTFANDRLVVPLQAADLIAWGLHRFLTKGEVPPGWERAFALPALRLHANERHLHNWASVLNMGVIRALELEDREREQADRTDSGNADRPHDPGAQP